MKYLVPLALLLALPGSALAQTTISFGPGIGIDGAGATATGSEVRITAGGRYVLSGTSADGSIVVDAPGQAVELELNGLDLTHTDGPAILFLATEPARLMLADGSSNSLADGGRSEFDAAIYSRPSLAFGGSGALAITAVYEGISSEMHLDFTGGDIAIRAGEDGINANNDGVSIITVSGGSLSIVTSGGDGIDSNGAIVITGGTVHTFASPTGANSGLDADNGSTISGGTVVNTSSRRGAQMARLGGAQPIVTAAFPEPQPAGTVVALVGPNGPELVFSAPSTFQHLAFSSPAVVPGANYEVFITGPADGQAPGVMPTESFAGGTRVGTVTASQPRP